MLGQGMLPFPIAGIHHQIDPGPDGQHPALDIHALILITQMAAFHQGVLPFPGAHARQGRAQPLHTPGIQAAGILPVVHGHSVMGGRAFQASPVRSIHIGIAARIDQQILSADHQVQMAFVKMPVAPAQAPAPQMEIVGLLVPAGTQIPVAALLLPGKRLLGQAGFQGLIGYGLLRPVVPDTLKIHPLIAAGPEYRLSKPGSADGHHIPQIRLVTVPKGGLGAVRLLPDPVGHRHGPHLLRHDLGELVPAQLRLPQGLQITF